MTDGTALSSVDAQAILGALRRHSPRRIIALRPDTIDGRIVDAVVVWLTEPIGLTGLGLEVGQRISDLASRQSLQDGVITAAIEAWSTPGVLTRTGPIEVDDGVTTRHLHVSIVAESDLLILEYDDVTDAVTSRAAAESGLDLHTLVR